MGFLDGLLSGLSGAPGFASRVELPEPAIATPQDLPRTLVDVAAGRRSVSSIFGEMAVKTAYSAVDEFMGRSSGAIAAARAAYEEAKAEWEDWLAQPPDYALINVSGEPDFGKTTCAFDLVDRYFQPAGRRAYAIGVPQDVLPPGIREIPIHKLNQLGRAIKKAADNGEDPKELIAAFRPSLLRAAVIIDDAGTYLAAGSSDKPENIAIKKIIDVRRHLRLIVINTFQDYSGVDVKFSKSADAYIMKPTNSAISGGDRPEVLRMIKQAGEWWDEYQARLSGEGLSRQEVKARSRLRAFVVCREVGFIGPWGHKRPDYYGERISRNVVHNEASEFIEGEYEEID